MPCELWKLFRYNRHLLNKLSKLAADTLIKTARKQGVIPGIFTVLHTFGRDLKWNVHIHLSVTRGGLTHDGKNWKPLYFSNAALMPQWRYAIIDLLRAAWDQGQLTLPYSLKEQYPDRSAFNHWLDKHYRKHWMVYFAKACDNAERNVEYLGRYLKRPPISMKRLEPQKENGKIQFRYFDHKAKQYLRCICSEEEFFKRLLQHIPDKGFRLIRYYGFLANRIRSKYLPTVYNLLNQPERNALKIQWPELMIASFGIDPLCCPRCGTRMIRMSLMPGRSLAELLTIHESWVIRPAIAA